MLQGTVDHMLLVIWTYDMAFEVSSHSPVCTLRFLWHKQGIVYSAVVAWPVPFTISPFPWQWPPEATVQKEGIPWRETKGSGDFCHRQDRETAELTKLYFPTFPVWCRLSYEIWSKWGILEVNRGSLGNKGDNYCHIFSVWQIKNQHCKYVQQLCKIKHFLLSPCLEAAFFLSSRRTAVGFSPASSITLNVFTS